MRTNNMIQSQRMPVMLNPSWRSFPSSPNEDERNGYLVLSLHRTRPLEIPGYPVYVNITDIRTVLGMGCLIVSVSLRDFVLQNAL